MCLARSTPHTGSSGAQGLWSEFTAKPQLAAPKGGTGPCVAWQILLCSLHSCLIDWIIWNSFNCCKFK